VMFRLTDKRSFMSMTYLRARVVRPLHPQGVA
jgi:hypothetical protein